MVIVSDFTILRIEEAQNVTFNDIKNHLKIGTSELDHYGVELPDC